MSPATPPWKHPMRRAARSLSPADGRAVLRRGAWGVLSLTAPGGHPYGVPLNYALWEPDPAPELPSTADAPFPPGFSLVFHSAMYGLKLDILSAAPEACFTVAPEVEVNPAGLTTRYESALVFGSVSVLKGVRRDAALLHLGRRFSAAYPEALARTLERSGPQTTALLMDIRGLTGKFNGERSRPSGPPDADRL